MESNIENEHFQSWDKIEPLLISRIKKGDLTAFEWILEHYKDPIYHFVRRMIGDPTEAEDITQQVFIQAYKAVQSFEPRAKFSTWLFIIARNLCLNELRRRQRHPASSLDEILTDEEGKTDRGFEDKQIRLPSEKLLIEELLKKLEDAIYLLPEAQRSALTLWVDTDMSYEEIAQVLGCSVAAVKSILHRARVTLKRLIREYLTEIDFQRERDSN